MSKTIYFLVCEVAPDEYVLVESNKPKIDKFITRLTDIVTGEEYSQVIKVLSQGPTYKVGVLAQELCPEHGGGFGPRGNVYQYSIVVIEELLGKYAPSVDEVKYQESGVKTTQGTYYNYKTEKNYVNEVWNFVFDKTKVFSFCKYTNPEIKE